MGKCGFEGEEARPFSKSWGQHPARSDAQFTVAF
jgi:hypothetical protein